MSSAALLCQRENVFIRTPLYSSGWYYPFHSVPVADPLFCRFVFVFNFALWRNPENLLLINLLGILLV